MQTKVQAYVQLADETSLKITGNYLDWLSFLTTASRLYKYPYHDQLMIYAQRPDASACAAYELWNGTMHRYIRRGAKGIALLNPTANGMRIRYIFDVSDTGTRADSRNVDVWQLTEAAEPAVRKMLAEEFSADASMRLSAQIEQLAERQALAYWNEHRRDILDSVDDSALSEYDDFAAGASFRKAAAASISAVIQTRCGLEPELLREDFQEVMDWNTPAAAAELGKAVSTIAEQVLRQIERTVRNAERSMEHERTEVHTARGLPAAGNGTDRRGTAAAGQVRDDAPAVSGERASGAVYAAAPERAADDAPARNRAERAESAEQPDAHPAEAERRDRGHEGGEPDALGGADEQPETSGGGNDSFGADLQLSGYTPQLEQMSFFLPTENEQIQLVDNFEAESAQAPFAFSVPQEVVDEFLRSGSNTADHRMKVMADFAKQLSPETIAQRLPRIYHGGFGMMYMGKPYSAWYDATGIRVASGKSARDVPNAQRIAWADAARRIGELLESGEFLGMMELAQTPVHERSMAAQGLWYMYHDMAEEGKGYFPSMKSIRGSSFPEETARLTVQLANPEFLSRLTAEAAQFAEDARENRNLLRFPFHNPETILNTLKELAFPRRDYDSLLAQVPKPDGFITEDEIDDTLSSGGNMSGGKRRIYQYFTETPARSMTEKANFLKDEYGIGGRTPAVSGADGSNEAHDSKGIVLQKNACTPVKMQWTKAAARIDTLIRQGQYLTQDAAADRGRQEADEDALPKETAPDANEENRAEQGEEADEPVSAEESAAPADAAENPTSSETTAYAVGDTVYLDDTLFVIEAKSAFGVQLRDPSQRYPIFRAESLPRFEQLLAADERNAHFLPAAETALRNIVLDLSASASEQREPAPEPPAAENFRITDEHLGEGSAKAKFSANIEAISVLKMVESEHRSALPQEQEVLSRYVGWGGLPQAFDERSEAWHSEYSALKSLLTQEEYETARASTLNAHYTSPLVIRAIYAAVEQLGFRSGNVLEPSCGVGNFFGMLPDSMKESRLYGVELDSITGRIAQQLYPKAHITIAGFETTDRRDFFDLAIGNVPFGAYQVQDKAFARHNFLIHDYFFAKTLEQVRPGGVIAYITSKGTMDKQNPAVRRYIAERAELLGAIRLPNTAFKANAGTEVTSDILFLQKRERPLAVEPDWVHLGQTANGIPVNSYFAAHPEMMLGTMVREPGLYGNENETACIPLEGAVLSEQLTEAVQHIRGEYQAAELPNQLEGEAAADTIPADPNMKNYAFTMVDGEVYYRTNSVMVRQKLPLPALERIRGMVDLRQQVNDLIQAQLDNADDAALAPIQARLNQQYDAFTAKYGLINARSNANAFSSDSSYYLLCSLEVLNEQGGLARKADMFTKRTIRQQTVITHVDTAAEALAVSIAEKARVDLPYMAQLTGIEPEQLTKELNGVIFPVPNQDIYVTADEYLSGNVRQKLREAMQAAVQNPLYLPNVTALKAAQPKDLDASEIDVRLGATWLDKSVIQDFMLETFAPPMYLHRVIHVNYSEYTAEWNISGKSAVSESSVTAYVTYGTRRANAYRILEDTLNLRDVRIYDMVTDSDGKERRVLNQKETTLAQQKQQAIKAAFREWIWKDPNRRETLVAQYNELFNATRPREYDGQHITFGGMTPDIQLREHQRNAVAHILYGGNTLLAHEVGAGKTFEMVAAAMESKRLGLCQKPLFVVPNHLTEQWASEFIRLYPSASILVATKKDFERANRQKFCARIATGDYDAVIIGHSQFERIPVSQERQQRLLREQLDDITHGIEELKYQRGEQFSIKQLERTRKQLENRLSKLEAEERKDDVVTFEQLGVDRLYVDEAHSFKNLFLYTKMRNVAGLSQTESQKSSDMFLKCRYMDEITGGKGIVFATGTPVSNSMTELYTMQRYLQYGTLQQKSMSHFDAWASTFGETTTAIELAPEGTGYRARTRFAKFFNLPELMNLFKEVADIKTADQLNLPRPTAHYETVVVKPSAYQQEMVQALSERAAAVHSGAVEPSVDNMLRITSDGRKLGLDQRLMNPLLPDDPGSKVNACVQNIVRIWREGAAEKLTQLVFCDLSTPRGKAASEKETADADTLLADETGSENFNVYDDIRAKLIAQGIPKEQIAFIHEANTEVRKKELFAKVRSGQVRVLMGSTAKMGAGTNVRATRS